MINYKGKLILLQDMLLWLGQCLLIISVMLLIAWIMYAYLGFDGPMTDSSVFEEYM